jgi:Abnormal spindle-like microcephaly-assoc'd, ASPM-SPD-2-Hydin
MGDAFSITTASGTIELDANRKGSASFSVTNVSGQALRARADVVAEAVAAESLVAEPAGAGVRESAPRPPAAPPPAAGWFVIAGEAERSFPTGGTEVYRVDVTVPAGAAPPPDAAPYAYRFRLDVLGTDNPDEDQAQGQWVQFTVSPQPVPPRRIPWLWILVAAAVALVVVVAVIVAVVLTHRQGTLSATPGTVNFGIVPVSTVATQAVTVKDTGPVGTTVTATITGADAADFSVQSAACLGHTLNPNATCVFNVAFKPTGKGNIVGSLQISGDHAATEVIALTGTGGQAIATASPFTLTPLGSLIVIWRGTATITNTGDTPLHVTSAAVTTNGIAMVIVVDGCLGQAVAPQQQCTVSLQSVAVFQGPAPSGNLTITSDATVSPLPIPFS